MQIGFVLAALLTLTLLGSAVVASVFEVICFAPAIGLYVAFRRALGRRSAPAWWRSASDEASMPARKGERLVMASWVACALVTVSLTAVELSWSPHLVTIDDRVGATLILAPIAIATCVMLVSSLIDWYMVTPRLSGRVCEPPCLDAEDPRWPAITQLVLVHRWIATFAVVAGLWLALAALGGVLAYHGALSLLDGSSASHPEAWAGVLAAASAIIVALGGWLSGLIALTAGEYLPALRAGTTRALHPPFAIGQYVKLRAKDVTAYEGYLLDVALEAITLVPFESIGEGEDHRLPVQLVTVAELEGTAISPMRGPYCGLEGCKFINERYCLRAKELRAKT